MTGSWRFAAFGKHPAARDYLRLGESFPLAQGLSDWVEKGYAPLSLRNRAVGDFCSWRFWARGAGVDAAVCGVVRDSSDGVGRSYPLLVVGTGMVPGLESGWERLPAACDRTWAGMEALCSGPIRDLRRLEEEIRRIPSPEACRGLSGVAPEAGGELGRAVVEAGPLREAFIPFDGVSFEALLAAHSTLKACNPGIPSSVFVGGNHMRTLLAVFRRPLEPGDFLRMWFETAQAGSPYGGEERRSANGGRR